MVRFKKTPRIFAFAWIAMVACGLSVIPNNTAHAEKTLTPASSQQAPEIFVQMGHASMVISVAFSPDGRYVLSGSGDKTLKLWEVSSGREIRTFQGHTNQIFSVTFSPDGRYALSGSNDDTVKLWDVSSGREIKTFHAWQVASVAFSPDGRYALSGGVDNTVKLWEVSSGTEIRTFQGHKDGVRSVAFSPDGKYALSGGGDNTLKLWEVSSGREIRTFQGHTNGVSSVAFSPDGKYALSGSWDKTLKLWEVSSGREIRAFQGQTNKVHSVTFSLDGGYVLAGSGDAKLWDLSSAREIRTFQGHTNEVGSVAFSMDGKYALSGSDDKTLRLWEVSSGREIRTFQGHTTSVNSVALSPDGRYALSSADWDKTLKLWEVSSGREIRTFQGHKDGVRSVAFSPDGRYALSGSGDNTLKLWEVSSGREIRTFLGHTWSVNSVAFSPDGRYTLSGSWDKTLKLWEVSSGREIRTFKGHTGTVSSVAFSPDGRHALSGSWDKTLRLWEVSSGREIRTFQEHMDEVYSVALSPDGKYALSGSESGATAIWDAASGKEIAQMVGFTDGEWVVITPEGYFNASPNGAKHLNVRIGNSVYGVDQFYAKFYRPELVQLALAGKGLPQGETLGDVLAKKNAPTVKILSPVSGSTVDKDSVTVDLKIADNGGGIGNVNIYLNGAQVANDTRGIIVKGKEPATERSLTFTISLMDGENEIKAVAMNREGSMESVPAAIKIISKAVLAKPNLYALVVGINEYKNKTISLSYAVSDAKAFAETLKKSAGPLFEKVQIKTLTGFEETTKEAISKAFDEIRALVKPNDLFVFYDASHGVVDVVNDEEQYFLLTSNVMFLSSRHIGEDAMSQKELAKLVGSIPAQKKLVILDTCNAGKGGKELQIALLQQTRGLTESTAIKLLQRAIGSSVFAASSDIQQALEGYKGHGLFTFVLLEGLEGKADIKKEGFVTVYGLADYIEEQVAKISEESFKRLQTPTIQTGTNFPIGKVR